MRRVLCSLPTKNHSTQLSDEEHAHLVRVLRLKTGDRVEVLDGQGGVCIAQIELPQNKRHSAALHWIETLPTNPGLDPLPIHLYIALLKGSAFLNVLEKCVELRVKTITPLITQRTELKPHANLERLFEKFEKCSLQALKQCGRRQKLELEPIQTFSEALKKISNSFVVLSEPGLMRETRPLISLIEKNQSFFAFIGPEGGWTETEIAAFLEKDVTFATMGAPTLRADTCSVACASVVSQFIE